MKLSIKRRKKLVLVMGIATLTVFALGSWFVLRPHTVLAPKTTSTPPVATTTQSAQANPTSMPTPPPTPPALVPPIDQFRARITKKFFGTYVTPANSPVQPERFQGYHLGVDVEYGDVTGDVPVRAIANGTVTYSGWVSGYGGVIVIRHSIGGKNHEVLYGHLNPSTIPAVGTDVTQSQQIGLLGKAYSHETDGERRHLHFSIRADDTISLLGYVQQQSQLSGWIDPLSLPF